MFSLFCNYLNFEKGVALHLNKLESPLPKDALCQVWLKSAQFWRKSWKCEKFIDRQTDRKTTDNRWSKKLTRAFSSGELKIKQVAHGPHGSPEKSVHVQTHDQEIKRGWSHAQHQFLSWSICLLFKPCGWFFVIIIIISN